MFDPYAPEFIEDPYPTYARLRADAPAAFHDGWGLTFFSRHADVVAILKDRRFGRDPRGSVPEGDLDPALMRRIYPPEYPTWTRLMRESFLDLEPPTHTRIRRLVQHAFTRRASESYRSRITATASDAMAAAVASGEMEAIGDFATPIPLTMIAELLGVPAEDQPQLVSWSHAAVRLFDEGCTEEEGAAAERAVGEFERYVVELLERHRRHPVDDLTSALLAAEVEGDRLTEEELVATCILTLNAGHEATVQAIGNALLALARHPHAYASLGADPGLIGSAAEELLRFDTPLQMFERWVLEDVVWDGVPLERGSKVGLLFGSANRDEARFGRPDELVLDRADNPHVSFGGGIHFCVGAPLARVELEVALQTFVEHVSEFSLATETLDRVPSLVFRGVRSLPLCDLVPRLRGKGPARG